MNLNKIVVITLLMFFCAPLPKVVHAAAADDLLAKYQELGAGKFSIKDGEAMWKRSFKDPEQGQERSCTTCHHSDLRLLGKHAQTGKPIEPMALSVNSKRLTDPKFIEKWFLRNCKWTVGRECTPQEKGNFLMYLKNQ